MNRTIVALLVFILLSSAAHCATDSEQARTIADANRESVITIELVVEQSFSYEGETDKREQKMASTGVIIDPSGLVVTSLASVNPTDMFSSFMDDDIGMTTEVKDLKIKLDDGTEIAYDMVLRDPDLDLAFMKPKKALDKPLKALDISQGSLPQMMDSLVLLYRLGSIASRSLAGAMSEVQAVVNKPRKFYVVDGMSMFNGVGSPAFTLDGKPAGILVLRTSKTDDGDGGFMAGMSFSGMIPIVLPCSDIVKAAEQAKAAKPEK